MMKRFAMTMALVSLIAGCGSQAVKVGYMHQAEQLPAYKQATVRGDSRIFIAAAGKEVFSSNWRDAPHQVVLTPGKHRLDVHFFEGKYYANENVFVDVEAGYQYELTYDSDFSTWVQFYVNEK